MNNNPLLDKEFLRQLDNQTEHDIFAKVISLTFDENPIEEITGRVTGGSVNIDGSSKMRRTCSVELVAQDVNINDYYWGLNTKFKLSIGIKNYINPKYPDIVWFKQGTFVITSFNTSLTAASYKINISGKDKMCLLNGEVGGAIESVSADFGKYDEIDEEGNITTKDFLLKDIILEAVHHYGREPFHNIIIEDLDEEGLELIEYRGDADVFFLFDVETGEARNMKFDDDEDSDDYFTYQLVTPIEQVIDEDESTISASDKKKVETITSVSLRNPPHAFNFDNRISALDLSEQNINDATRIIGDDGKIYTVAKATYGDTCGYRLTDLTYAGDLILSTGNAVTEALDKIVNMLGEFEYFYNLDGQFVFRKKHTYLNTSWNTIVSGEASEQGYVENSAYSSAYTYSFTDSNLISAFTNQPKLENLRNDYSIWGTKNNEAKTQFHLRYAIDKKPLYYKNYNGKIFLTQEEFDRKTKEAENTDLESNITVIQGGSKFRLNPLIDGLSEDWWEIGDWTRRYLFFADVEEEHDIDYYVKLTDQQLVTVIDNAYKAVQNKTATTFQTYAAVLQQQSLGKFATEWPSYVDWLSICPAPTDRYVPSAPYNSLLKGNIFWTFLVDILFDDFTNKPFIAYQSHGATFTSNASTKPQSQVGSGCGHKFSYALTEKANGNSKYTYFYKPKIPDSIKLDETLITIKENESSTQSESIITQNYLICDWREIIYQMALDYYKNGHAEDFNPILAQHNAIYYPSGYTGYEQYYADMQGFWREIYNPELTPLTITEDNITTLIPDKDQYKYYVWDSEYKKFDSYTFDTATTIQAVPNKKIYYTYGTINWPDLAEKIKNGEAVRGADSLLRKITEQNEYIYYCYTENNDAIIYHWLNDDVYQVYKKYHNYQPNEGYYDYGLALDLTDLSQTKTYFYTQYEYTPVTISEESYKKNYYYYKYNNEYFLAEDDFANTQYYTCDIKYIPGQKIFLDNEFTYVGQIAENLFTNRDCTLFIKNTSGTYEVADRWSNTLEYYKQLTPINFNKFGTDYYEYIGYVESPNLEPGKSYAVKNTEENDLYIPCSNVLSEKSCFKPATNITANNFTTDLYTKISEPAYFLDGGSFDKDIQYYNKTNVNNYTPIALVQPNPIGDVFYYIEKLQPTYSPASRYLENTIYYKEAYPVVTLLEANYEPNKYYVEDEYVYQANVNVNSVLDYYTKGTGYDTVEVDEEEYKLGKEQYFIKTMEYVEEKKGFDSSKQYFIKDKVYPVVSVSASTWKAGKYYVFDSKSGTYKKDSASAYNTGTIYHNYEENFILAPTLTKSDFEREGTKEYTSTQYYVFSNGKYKLATGAYSSVETYYTRGQDTYSQASVTKKNYKKNKYYIKKDGKYVLCTKKKFKKQSYFIKNVHYYKDTVTREEYDTKTKITTTSSIKYYYRSNGFAVAEDAFNPAEQYYIEIDTYKKVSELKANTGYYRLTYELCDDEEFDEQATYYMQAHKTVPVSPSKQYVWSELLLQSMEKIYVPTQNTNDLDITYYADNQGKTVLNIYRSNKYYQKMAKDIDTYYPAEKYATNTTYYEKIMITFLKDGVQEEGFFNDGVHTFYLKSGDKYIKQTEYASNNKDLYYVLNEFTPALTIDVNKQYYDKYGAKTTSFMRGETYYLDNKCTQIAFIFDKFATYYTYVGYNEVKTTKHMVYGISYLEYGTANIQTSNYKMYPNKIYYGYTETDLWDQEIDLTDTNSKLYQTTGEHDYYVKNGQEFDKERILHHFLRSKQYYVHERGYDMVDNDSIRMELISYLYPADPNTKKPTSTASCLTTATQILNKHGTIGSDVLEEIFNTTGLLFSADPRGTSATIQVINTEKSYCINQCAMRPYNYLRYNFSPLPALVYDTDKFNPETFWTFDLENPENLIFWFDFMDTSTGSELSQYGVNYIGNRPKAIKDDSVKAIYYRDTPNVIFIDSEIDEIARKNGYAYIQLNDNVENLFSLSAQGKTAFNVLDSFLYDYSYCIESITLTSIPVYYLEPNTRIFVYNEKDGINGEYLVSKISIPLAYNGTMSIQATKAIDRIY